MKTLFTCLALALAALTARAAVTGVVPGTNDLVNYINPHSANTNYWTISDDGVIGSGPFSFWNYDSASAAAQDENHLKPLFTTGRWIRNLNFSAGGGGTNIFNTLIVTNLTVNNNLYLTTNTYVIIGTDTNLVGLWTDFPTFIAPTSFTNVFHVGKDGYLNVTGPTFSELQLNGPTSTGFMIDLYADDASRYFHMSTPLNGGMVEAVIEPTLVEGADRGPFWFGTEQTYATDPIFALVNGTNAITTWDPILTFGPASQINFSTTNVLYRSVGDLIYTNGSIPAAFIGVQSGSSANIARFGASAGQVAIEAASGASIRLLPDASSQVYVFDSGAFSPGTDNTLSVGTAASNGAWKDSYFKGVQHMVASNDGAGNYSWVKCFVTNGVAVFDFVNAGSGTAPSKFSFMFNGVEQGHIP